MDARNNDFDFDFMPIGQAIKKARTARGMTRDELSRIVDYDPRHLQAIYENGTGDGSVSRFFLWDSVWDRGRFLAPPDPAHLNP